MSGMIFDRRRQALELRRSAFDNVAKSWEMRPRAIVRTVRSSPYFIKYRILVNRQTDKALSDNGESKCQSGPIDLHFTFYMPAEHPERSKWAKYVPAKYSRNDSHPINRLSSPEYARAIELLTVSQT
jgi:hypothetical protein